MAPWLLALLVTAGGAGLVADVLRRAPHETATHAWLGPALALACALACAGALDSNVLFMLGGVASLAAAAGVLSAGAASRWLRWRALAILVLVLVSVPVALSLVQATADRLGGPADTLSQLGAILGGRYPGELQTAGLLIACWLTGIWVGWMALRERSGLLACAVPMILLSSDLVNVSASLDSAPFWPVIGAVASGLGLLGWGHADGQLARWRRLAVHRPRPRSGTPVIVVSALLVSAVALLLPPLNQNNFSSRFFHSGPQVTVSSAQQQATAPISGYSTSVVPGGPIRQVASPVLSYTTSAPGGTVYLAGVTLTTFNNGNWYPAIGVSGTLEQGAQIPYSERYDTTATESARSTASLHVTFLGAGAQEVANILYPGSPLQIPYDKGPYQVKGLAQGGQLVSVTSVAAREGTPSVLGVAQEITTYGSISTATPAQLEAAGTNYPNWVRPLTSLPALEAPIEEAQVAADALSMSAGATNPYQAALNIQNALRADELYTLDPPTPPPNEWPIVYFLNQSHRGYCQYFASAMGAMLRALGIPSRLVNGFGPGEEGTLPNGQHLITEADAHTWVQVYFPHYGWVNFEPTPDGFYQPTGAVTTTTPGSTAPLPGSQHPGVRSGGHNPGSAHLRTHSGPISLTLVAVGVGIPVLIVALLLLGLVWTRRVRNPRELRRRLELVLRLAGDRDCRARTLTELAAGCKRLVGTVDSAAAVTQAARTADRMAFGRTAEDLSQHLRASWRRVGYVTLLRRAVAAGWTGRRRSGDTGLTVVHGGG